VIKLEYYGNEDIAVLVSNKKIFQPTKSVYNKLIYIESLAKKTNQRGEE